MKQQFLALILAFGSSSLAEADEYPPASRYSHSSLITQVYDKFEDDTTLKVYLADVFTSPSDKLSLSVLRVSNGEKRTKGGVYFSFRNVGRDGWRYLKYHPVVFLVDGERWAFDPDHDGEVETGYVTEHLFISISEGRFLKLVSAKSVEIKVGGDVVNISSDHRNALRDFASLIGDPDAPLPTERRFRTPPPAPARPMSDEEAKRQNESRARQRQGEEMRAIGVKADARLNSAKGFEKDGKKKLAIKYYREVVIEFAGTPQANEANRKLKELDPDAPDPKVIPSNSTPSKP